MLSIRLARVGRVNLPSYRIVVQEKTRSPHSKVVEIIGSYDPKVEPAKLITKKERLDHWLKAGARPTLSLAELLVKQDLIKLEQVPELQHERARREAGKKRVADKRTWKEKVAKEIKARNEAKQKTQAAPKAEAPKTEAKPAAKPEEKK
ncbi:MAG: 30S ribosomal protein S16 [Candidatus Andersenbacteria bacterium]